jgi:hypothetical protein
MLALDDCVGEKGLPGPDVLLDWFGGCVGPVRGDLVWFVLLLLEDGCEHEQAPHWLTNSTPATRLQLFACDKPVVKR